MSKEYTFEERLLVNQTDLLVQRIKPLKIATDIDGVDAFTQESGLTAINNLKGTSFQLTDLKVDLVAKYLKDVRDPKKFATEIWNSNANLSTTHVVSGALILSRFLFEKGINIPRITSRPSYTRDVTLEWYAQKMPWIKPEQIIMQTKSDNINFSFKVDQIKKLGIELFFEDSFEHAVNIVENTDAKVVLIPHYWNEDFILKEVFRYKNILVPHRGIETPAKLINVFASLINFM